MCNGVQSHFRQTQTPLFIIPCPMKSLFCIRQYHDIFTESFCSLFTVVYHPVAIAFFVGLSSLSFIPQCFLRIVLYIPCCYISIACHPLFITFICWLFSIVCHSLFNAVVYSLLSIMCSSNLCHPTFIPFVYSHCLPSSVYCTFVG